MLTEHIAYEIEMMRSTFLALSGPVRVLFSQVIVNALIEAFCIHARNLIEFFNSTVGPTNETAAAHHFTRTDYRPWPKGAPAQRLIEKLHKQIAHPSYGRTGKAEGKIGRADREVLMKIIDDEVANFSRHLVEPYSSLWLHRMARVRTR